jgi:hypothetical protein
MTKQQQNELNQIAAASEDHVLRAEDLIEFARNPKTAVHSLFEWDRDKNAYQHLLTQARQIIAVHVIVLPKTGIKTRQWVSLTTDRCQGGGYRSVVSVLSKKDLRRQMLNDALQELERFEEKYRSLQELADVFKAAKKIRIMQKQE